MRWFASSPQALLKMDRRFVLRIPPKTSNLWFGHDVSLFRPKYGSHAQNRGPDISAQAITTS